MQRTRSSLTLAIIASNEADRIGRAIASVPFADEIVVVESGSTDGTEVLAATLGARVVRTDWPGFVAQKNRALRLATSDWVLSLDADEWLTPPAQREVLATLERDDVAGASFPRLSEWGRRAIRHGRWYPDRRLRLVRRDRARWVGPEPVDTLEVDGPVVPLKGDIGHRPYRDLGEHLATIDRYTRAQAATLRAHGRRGRIWDPALHGGWHLFRALVLDQGLRDGPHGVALAGLGAAHAALKWHRTR